MFSYLATIVELILTSLLLNRAQDLDNFTLHGHYQKKKEKKRKKKNKKKKKTKK